MCTRALKEAGLGRELEAGVSSGILEVKGIIKQEKRNSTEWRSKPATVMTPRQEKIGYPKLGFSKGQEEDKKLQKSTFSIELLMHQQAGGIISESPFDLAGGRSHIHHPVSPP